MLRFYTKILSNSVNFPTERHQIIYSDKEETMKAEVIATDKYGLDVGIKEQCSKM